MGGTMAALPRWLPKPGDVIPATRTSIETSLNVTATVPPIYPGGKELGVSWLYMSKPARQRCAEYTPRDPCQKTEVTAAAPAMFQIPQVVSAKPANAPPWDYITKPPRLLNRDPRATISIDAPAQFHLPDAVEFNRQVKERDKRMGRPDVGAGRSINYHQKLIYGKQTMLLPEPKLHEAPGSALERVHARDSRRTQAYAKAALDPSHLPMTPPGGTSVAQERGVVHTKRVSKCHRTMFDDTRGAAIVHDIGKYPFPRRQKQKHKEGHRTEVCMNFEEIWHGKTMEDAEAEQEVEKIMEHNKPHPPARAPGSRPSRRKTTSGSKSGAQTAR